MIKTIAYAAVPLFFATSAISQSCYIAEFCQNGLGCTKDAGDAEFAAVEADGDSLLVIDQYANTQEIAPQVFEENDARTWLLTELDEHSVSILSIFKDGAFAFTTHNLKTSKSVTATGTCEGEL